MIRSRSQMFIYTDSAAPTYDRWCVKPETLNISMQLFMFCDILLYFQSCFWCGVGKSTSLTVGASESTSLTMRGWRVDIPDCAGLANRHPWRCGAGESTSLTVRGWGVPEAPRVMLTETWEIQGTGHASLGSATVQGTGHAGLAVQLYMVQDMQAWQRSKKACMSCTCKLAMRNIKQLWLKCTKSFVKYKMLKINVLLTILFGTVN